MKHFGLNNERYSTISRYVIATAIALAAIALVAVYFTKLAAGFAASLAWIYAIVSPLIIGGIAAILLYPAVNKVSKLLQKLNCLRQREGVAHVLAVLLVLVLFLMAIMVLGALLLSVITGSIHRIRPENLEALANYLVNSVDDLYQWIMRTADNLGLNTDELNSIIDNVGNFIVGGNGIQQTVTKSVNAVRRGASTFVFATIFAIYLMVDAPNLGSYWRRVLPDILGKKNYDRFSAFRADVVFAFTGYMRGQFIDALLMGFMVSIALSLIKVEFAPVIGVATGIGNLIPYVGPLVAYALTILVCLMNGELTKLIIAAILLLIIQFVDGQIINPKILSDSVEVHPILVLISLTAGAKIGGVLGMFVAVPCAALLKIYFEKFVAWRHNKLQTKTQVEDELTPSDQDLTKA